MPLLNRHLNVTDASNELNRLTSKMYQLSSKITSLTAYAVGVEQNGPICLEHHENMIRFNIAGVESLNWKDYNVTLTAGTEDIILTVLAAIAKLFTLLLTVIEKITDTIKRLFTAIIDFLNGEPAEKSVSEKNAEEFLERASKLINKPGINKRELKKVKDNVEEYLIRLIKGQPSLFLLEGASDLKELFTDRNLTKVFDTLDNYEQRLSRGLVLTTDNIALFTQTSVGKNVYPVSNMLVNYGLGLKAFEAYNRKNNLISPNFTNGNEGLNREEYAALFSTAYAKADAIAEREEALKSRQRLNTPVQPINTGHRVQQPIIDNSDGYKMVKHIDGIKNEFPKVGEFKRWSKSLINGLDQTFTSKTFNKAVRKQMDRVLDGDDIKIIGYSNKTIYYVNDTYNLNDIVVGSMDVGDDLLKHINEAFILTERAVHVSQQVLFKTDLKSVIDDKALAKIIKGIPDAAESFRELDMDKFDKGVKPSNERLINVISSSERIFINLTNELKKSFELGLDLANGNNVVLMNELRDYKRLVTMYNSKVTTNLNIFKSLLGEIVTVNKLDDLVALVTTYSAYAILEEA